MHEAGVPDPRLCHKGACLFRALRLPPASQHLVVWFSCDRKRTTILNKPRSADRGRLRRPPPGQSTMRRKLKIPVRRHDGMRQFECHVSAALRCPDATLEVPQSISYGGYLGRSIAFAQLIATWANSCVAPRIRTTLERNSPHTHSSFVSRIHGLAAAYYAKEITAKDGTTNLKNVLLQAAKPRIEAMAQRQFATVAKGQLTELIFVHHALRQFHSATYRRQPRHADLMDPERHGELIVPPREMNALITNALEAQRLLHSDLAHIQRLLEKEGLPLGHLLHEVFRNTAEHAYLHNRRIPTKGIRCILIAVRACDPSSLQPHALTSVEHPSVTAYFDKLRQRAGLHRDRVHLLELSVLDTGPGFVETIRSALPQATSDANCVQKCFEDHVSSKLGLNSGLGLGRILSQVNSLRGFTRIRTSTTEALFASSFAEPLSPHVASELPKICGTALTVAIPLGL